MVTTKRLVLLLLTGMVIASVACGLNEDSRITAPRVPTATSMVDASIRATLTASANAPPAVVVTPTPRPSPTPLPYTSMDEIMGLRKANELAADEKYVGMLVRIKGTVKNIETDNIFILSSSYGINCTPSKSQSDALLTLRTGDSIVVKGRITSIHDFLWQSYVDIKSCKFTSPIPAEPMPVAQVDKGDNIPIHWNQSALRSALLSPNDFPEKWQVMVNPDGPNIKATRIFVTAKKVDIYYDLYDSGELASEAYENRRAKAQETITSRGISGDVLDELDYNGQMFVWISGGNRDWGTEVYQVVSSIDNVVFRLVSYGSMAGADKDLAIEMSRKQIDKILTVGAELKPTRMPDAAIIQSNEITNQNEGIPELIVGNITTEKSESPPKPTSTPVAVNNCVGNDSFQVSGEISEFSDGTTISGIIEGVTVASTVVSGQQYILNVPLCDQILGSLNGKLLSFVVNNVTAHEQAIVMPGAQVTRNPTFPESTLTLPIIPYVEKSYTITYFSNNCNLLENEIDSLNSPTSEPSLLFDAKNVDPTMGLYGCEYLSWSPDGSQFIFKAMVKEENNAHYSMHGRVYMTNVDGSKSTFISPLSSMRMVWSLDGSKIAYHHSDHGTVEIYVMNWDGSNTRKLTTSRLPTVEEQNRCASENVSSGLPCAWANIDPSWSPDSTQLVFVSEQYVNDQIYLINADGSNLRRLVVSGYEDRSPAWSPDGSKIIFTRGQDAQGTIGTEIISISPNGSNQLILAENGEFYRPAWSPDGSKIAYYGMPGNGKDRGIWVMDADGNNHRLITQLSDPVNIAWKPIP